MTWISAAGMSALCQKRTHAVQQFGLLLDHLVGAAKQRKRDRQPKRLGGLLIDYQLNFCRLLDRQIGRFLAFENPPGVDAD